MDGETTGWAAARREDLVGELQAQVALGHHTVDALAAAVGAEPAAVDAALAWGASQGLLARSPRPGGDWVELTPQGAATLAFRQSVQRATRPDGRVDIGDVVGDMAEAAQAAETARRRQQEQEEAHLLVGTPEREAVVAFLNEQYARGTLDLAELERRSGLALSARSRGDLAVATADLGWPGLEAAAPARAAAFPVMRTTFTQVSPLLGGNVLGLFDKARFVLFGVVAVILGLPLFVTFLMSVVRLFAGS